MTFLCLASVTWTLGDSTFGNSSAIMNSTPVNIHGQIFVQTHVVFISLEYTPSCGIASHVLNFLRNCQNVFQSNCNIPMSNE